MKLSERLRNMARSWLKIDSATYQHITIKEYNDLQTNQMKNRIWYRGDASEIEQFFKALRRDNVNEARFWTAAPGGKEVRKAHSGVPSVIVNTLSYIVKADLDDIDVTDGDAKITWEEIAKDNDFEEVVGQAVADTMAIGDGAFKISIDKDVSEYPIIEFWPGDRVDFIQKHGRTVAVVFKTNFYKDNGMYLLKELYAKNRIEYHLFSDEDEVPLDTIEELKDYEPIAFKGDFMLAVPFIVYKSQIYDGRGRSVFDNKTDAFDSHDEVVSQWIDAVRQGRVAKYIPEDMIPRDPKNGSFVDPSAVNSFGTNFVITSPSNKENAVDSIVTIQPQIDYSAFIQTYSTTLDMCLQGIISPATLGIDVAKMATAESQREKKDITGYTRNAITDRLEKVLPKVANIALKSYDLMNGRDAKEYECSITFGEYGAPDFDSRVATVSAASSTGIMSIESQVEELWGATKDDEWKGEEVQRIMRDRGLIQAPEPAVNNELIDIEEEPVE